MNIYNGNCKFLYIMSVLLYRFLIIQVSDYTSVTVWLIQTFLIVLYIVLHCISVKWIPTFLDTVSFCTLSVVLLSTLYEYPPSWTLSVSVHCLSYYYLHCMNTHLLGRCRFLYIVCRIIIYIVWIPTFLDAVGFCTLSVVLLSTLYEYPPFWTPSVSPHWPAAIRPAFWTSDVCTPRWFLCWTPRAPPSPSGRPHPPPLPAWPSPWKRAKNSSEN